MARSRFADPFGRSLKRLGTPPALRRTSVLFDGHFIGDYSLAIVNRALARHLIERGLSVRIHCLDPVKFPREAIGDALLAPHVVDDPADAPDIHLRNHWPPAVETMRGHKNILAGFAWEETALPEDLVESLNAHLSLVTVPSQFVADALLHSGVGCPVVVVGNGCDHISPGRAAPDGNGLRRFLHISSGLPRKGVDVLLDAYSTEFAASEAVELVIKTTPNPNNVVAEAVARVRADRPSAPPVHIIEESLDPSALANLVASADAVVQASRGEGFCLPLAEAMMNGVPVITTAFGGQAEFCDDSTAEIVAHRKVLSRSHVAAPHGLWAEPSVDDLRRAMRRVLQEPGIARAKALHGRDRLRARHRWTHVASRTIAALSALPDGVPASVRRPEPDIDVVTSWRQRCGIATYSEALFSTPALGPRCNRILARQFRGDSLPENARETRDDLIDVLRPWGYARDGIDRLSACLQRPGAPILWIQHHTGFFSADDMRRLRPGLDAYRHRIITLHNAAEAIAGGVDWLRAFDLIFVHSGRDIERLARVGIDRALFLPHGVPRSAPAVLGRSAGARLASFGFLQPHKNMAALVAAFGLVRQAQPDATLTLCNCVQPNENSRMEADRISYLIDRLGLCDHVEHLREYRTEDEVVATLGAADILVFPYTESGESATGAARLALAADRPILVSQDSALSDLAPVSHVLRDAMPETVAEAALTLLAAGRLRHRYDRVRRAFAERTAFPRVAERADTIIRGRLAHG